MAHGVHPAVKGVEPPGGHAFRNGGTRESKVRQLGRGHDSVLAGCQRSEGCVTFVASW